MIKDVDTKALGDGTHEVLVNNRPHPHLHVVKINRSRRAKKLYALTTNLNSGKVYKKGSLSDIKDFLFRRINQPLVRKETGDSVSP